MRRRGSTTILLVCMLASTGLLLLSVVSMAGNASERQSRREHEFQAKLLFEAAVTDVLDRSRANTLTLPHTSSIALSGVTANIAVSADASVARGLVVTASVDDGVKQYRYERLVGNRKKATPFQFALFTEGNLDVNSTLSIGNASTAGSLFADGNVRFADSMSYLYGSIYCTGDAQPNGSVVTQGCHPSSNDIALPGIPSVQYLAAADETVLGSNNRNGYAFGRDYGILVVSGDLTLKGVITGRGLIYASGNINFAGTVSYANASSKVVFVSGRDINIYSAVTSLVGVMFAAGTIDANSVTTSLNVNGSLIADRLSSDAVAKPLTITFDPFLLNDSEAKAMHVPGYWP